MMRIALLGIGAMGYGIAQRLLDSGFAVDVWNRTGKPAGLLAEYGATAHATPREAVSAADVRLDDAPDSRPAHRSDARQGRPGRSSARRDLGPDGDHRP